MWFFIFRNSFALRNLSFPIFMEQNPHDWWGFRGNGGDLVAFSLVQLISAVEIVYKESEVKMAILLRSFLRF